MVVEVVVVVESGDGSWCVSAGNAGLDQSLIRQDSKRTISWIRDQGHHQIRPGADRHRIWPIAPGRPPATESPHHQTNVHPS